ALGCNPTTAAINTAFGTASATDNCGSVTVNYTDGEISNNGCMRSLTRTFTSTDACNNTSTATRIVTWKEDSGLPTITCAADKVISCTSTVVFDTPVYSDGCSSVTLTGSAVTQFTNPD